MDNDELNLFSSEPQQDSNGIDSFLTELYNSLQNKQTAMENREAFLLEWKNKFNLLHQSRKQQFPISAEGLRTILMEITKEFEHKKYSQPLNTDEAEKYNTFSQIATTLLSSPDATAFLEQFFNYTLQKNQDVNDDLQTFALPSHPLMLTLVAMFAGRPEKMPRKILEKPFEQRTEEEQAEAEQFLNSIIERRVIDYDERGRQQLGTFLHIANTPKVQAIAQISSLLQDDVLLNDTNLAQYVKRTFGAEGMRHVLGMLISLEKNSRKGYFEWEVNEHLSLLGYKKEASGSFKQELKETAYAILKILTSLHISAERHDKGEQTLLLQRLFSISAAEIKQKQGNTPYRQRFLVRAEDAWYRYAFTKNDEQSQQFTKLLMRIARENHREHPLTIVLSPLFSIFWRINPEKKMSVARLMEWCDLDYTDRYKLRKLRELEEELDYMCSQQYLGEWINITHHGKKPSECVNPFECVILFLPPDWLKNELTMIAAGNPALSATSTITNELSETKITVEILEMILKQSGLKVEEFAERLGISRQMVSYVRTGKKKISEKLAKRIAQEFAEYIVPRDK